jgi:hypothetical protein
MRQTKKMLLHAAVLAAKHQGNLQKFNCGMDRSEETMVAI